MGLYHMFDLAEQLYAYCTLNHGGQGSRQYEILSEISSWYKPGSTFDAEKVLARAEDVIVTEENYEDLFAELESEE